MLELIFVHVHQVFVIAVFGHCSATKLLLCVFFDGWEAEGVYGM